MPIDLSYLNPGLSGNKTDKNILNATKRLQKYGFGDLAEEKPKKNFLFDTLLGDWLQRPLGVTTSLLSAASPDRTFAEAAQQAADVATGKKKYETKELLNEAFGESNSIGRKVAEFGTGIALDPLTYLSLGKILGGAKNLGKKIPGLSTAINYGDDLVTKGRKALGIAKLTPEEQLAKLRLSGASGGVQYELGKNVDKYKGLLSRISKTSDEQLDLVRQALDVQQRLQPGLFENVSAVDDIAKNAIKGMDEKTKHVYYGLKKMFKTTGDVKESANIVDNLVQGYFPHMLTDEYREKMIELGKNPQEMIETLKGLAKMTGAKKEKARSLIGMMSEFNKESMEKLGVNMFETDLKKVVPKYLYSYSKNKSLAGLSDELLKITDDAGRGLIQRLTTDEVPEGLVKLTGFPYQGNYATTPEVAKMVNRTVGVLSSDPTLNKFLKGFDKMQSMWKKGVTVYNPSFHLNNLMGGSFNNFIDNPGTLRPDVIKKAYTMSKEKFDDFAIEGKGGSKIMASELKEWLAKHGGVTTFFSPEKMVKKGNPITEFIGEKLGGRTEELLRFQSAIGNFKKYGNLDDVLKKIFEVHGNYNPEALSSAGRNVIKRIAPFYVWSKTNIPFQIKNIINQTGKYSALGRLQEQIMPLEERKKLPDYLQEKFLLGGKNLPSGDKSIRMANLPVGDLQDLTSLKRLIGNRLTPFLKAPIELMANKNLYFDSEIVDKDLPFKLQKANIPDVLKMLPEAIKSKIPSYNKYENTSGITGKTKTKEEIGARTAYLLNQFASPLGRIAPVFTGGENEALASGKTPSAANAFIEMFNPLKAKTYNTQDQEAINKYLEQQKLQDIINYLIKRGLIPKSK